MKHRRYILAAMAICAVLALQTGCDEPTALERPTTDAAEPAPPVLPPSDTDKGPSEPVPEPPPQVVPKAEPPAQIGTPKITFEKVLHDFGKIEPATTSICEFAFTNTGDGPLEIRRVRTCCGIRAKLKDGKKVYKPQESGTVMVTFNSARFRGVLEKVLHVLSNDIEQPRAPLRIRAIIVKKVQPDPAQLKLSLRDKNAGCPNITLTSTDGQPFAVKGFSSTDDFITAPFDSSADATQVILEPKVDMAKLRSVSNGKVRISLTHPKCSVLTIPFEVLAEFTAEPASIMIRDVEPEKPIRKEVWVVNNYDQDFEVESATSRKGMVKLLRQEKVGKRYKLELEITPPAVKSQTRIFYDKFIVNMKGGERLSISCRVGYLINKNKSAR
ncbi:MAG: DUF1573 domain-containing protein, partial [Planctomycetota bacterium]